MWVNNKYQNSKSTHNKLIIGMIKSLFTLANRLTKVFAKPTTEIIEGRNPQQVTRLIQAYNDNQRRTKANEALERAKLANMNVYEAQKTRILLDYQRGKIKITPDELYKEIYRIETEQLQNRLKAK